MIPIGRMVDWYARGVGGAAAREIKGIPADRQSSEESKLRSAGISSPPECRPTVDETCGIVCRRSTERLAYPWCERARVLVEHGASKAPPIAPWVARLGSALFRF